MLNEIQNKYLKAIQSIPFNKIDPRLVNNLIKAKVFAFDNHILQINVNDQHSQLIASTTYFDVLKTALIKEFEYFNQEIHEVLFLTDEEIKILSARNQLIMDLQKANANEIINFKKELKELTFARLVKTTYNLSAINAIHQLLDDDYNIYSYVNPIFIFGKVGIGKTHLAAAAANEYHKKDPTKRIYYIEASEYFRRFSAAAFKGVHVVEQLKNEIESSDLLIIDDIQNLSDKTKALEMFFNIFNTIKNNGGKIIITADKKTSELVAFETRLLSRLASGLQVKLSVPSVSDATEIINNWLLINKHFTIASDAINYIANHFHKDIRQLIGFLKQIGYWALSGEKKVSYIELPFIQEKSIEYGIGLEMIDNKIDPAKVISKIAHYHNMNESLILSDSRKQEVVWIRSIIIYVLRHSLNMTYTEIASLLNMKSHSTVTYAFDKIAKKIDEDEIFAQQLKVMIEKVVQNN
ncbi:DnaA/Hda family protein [Ureaplasma sp. ES3154-GEN]|uniref:DnaA ATPase domain-containing protein n=1 Tax=Ureaplasma sp. ES3154-GEN TaxID=2984844 RepID=UPI0021E80B3E|nr:DnaA/Hda family protein [Ureaplasma sp. ES3154-GEN]MCV3743472.1 DnaA/Hda family protein [Ureaplasma sp. ES3154-GEN]